ncbi:MAG: superoxide dismutase, Ni [Deltaproteobacteria bacterium]|nr:MAG: superoxide dismutase, Ni [Deltaproteobacteria bacterium]
MLHRFFKHMDQTFRFPEASAHCDIPCGIYDPITAQISALTVIRMADLIAELAEKPELTVADQARLSRLVSQKEEHALKVKEEVRIIWGDFFKAPQFEKVPDAHELVHNIMMQGSKCRQHVDREMAVELLNLVNQFAEAFWLTKGVPTYAAPCPYPPSEMVIYPKLEA